MRHRRALGQLEHPAGPADVVAELLQQPVAVGALRHRAADGGVAVLLRRGLHPAGQGGADAAAAVLRSTPASPRLAPISSPNATSRSPCHRRTRPSSCVAKSKLGRCQSASKSAASTSTRPMSCCCWAAATAKTASRSAAVYGAAVRPAGRSGIACAALNPRVGASAPEMPTARARRICRSRSRRLGRIGSGALDRADVEVQLDPLGDEHAAGLERGVPGQAPVLAVDGGAALEADAQVAEGVTGRAGLLELDRDRLGDALDGQVAGDDPGGRRPRAPPRWRRR